MSFLYVTADTIGAPSGGGRVTQEESTALVDLGIETGTAGAILSRTELDGPGEDPWKYDEHALDWLNVHQYFGQRAPSLCHVYAGTFSQTITRLQEQGCKVSYTAAAHSVYLSEQEHVRLGIPFDYPHLTNAVLWQRYVAGYLKADVVVCPSQHSAEQMRGYGCRNVVVIPHGVDIPEHTAPLPDRFTVGYLGSVLPDKGLLYLLFAWKALNYQDGELWLAGGQSESELVLAMLRHVYLETDPIRTTPPRVRLLGWVEHIEDFYKNVSLYVQPSVTEGFGIEVLESLAHARPVLCSTGAGAADVVPETWRFPARDVSALADKIDQFRKADLAMMGRVGRELAREYTWDRIRARYQQVWRELLGEAL